MQYFRTSLSYQLSLRPLFCLFEGPLDTGFTVLYFPLQTERDVSVRQRAVDLLYAMCDRTNAEEIVGEMLEYLETADYSIREEMVRLPLDLTFSSQMGLSTIISWTSLFPILGVLGGIFHIFPNFDRTFCKQTVKIMSFSQPVMKSKHFQKRNF